MATEFKVFGDNETEKRPEKETPKNNGNKMVNKVAKLFKRKPFLIAVVVVVFLGVFAWYRKSRVVVTTTNNEDEEMLLADGLQVMYPSTDSYASSDSAYFEDVIETLDEYYQTELLNVQHVLDVTVDDMSTQITALSNRIDTQNSAINEYTSYIEKQNDIQTMQRNSDYWFYATPVEREELEKINDKIADKYNWVRGEDGVWYENGVRVYETVTQKNSISSTPSNKSLSSSNGSTNVSNVSDVDKMKANSQAWHTATDSEKQKLHEENKQIASKNNWTFDSSTGTYKDSAGNRVY